MLFFHFCKKKSRVFFFFYFSLFMLLLFSMFTIVLFHYIYFLCEGISPYSSSPQNRGTWSSNVRKAGALVPPPSCLGGGPHGWVPVDTHSTPVLPSGRRLWVAQVVHEPNDAQNASQPNHFVFFENFEPSCFSLFF